MQALRHHQHFLASLQRHGSLRVTVTDEDRQAGQAQADQWAPPLNEICPHATVTVGDPNVGASGRGEYPQVEITSEDIRQLVTNCEKKALEHRQ